MGHCVEQHFEGRSPQVFEIYQTILAKAREFGPVAEDPKKTSIHLNRKTAFAGIATRRQHLIVTIKATSDIDDPRISRRLEASARRWYLYIKVSNTAEVDSQFIGWLQNSYELSG